MNLVPDHVRRALAYLSLLSARGVSPSRSSVEKFAVTAPPSGPLFLPSIVSIFPERGPAEPVVDYLADMGWAEAGKPAASPVHLTALGEAFARALESDPAVTEPTVADVVLEPSDPLAWVHLTRRAARAGAGMLVDPYFKAESVPWLVEATSLRRVLTSSRHAQARLDLKVLGVALATVPGAAEVEIRASSSKEMHDRCLIAEGGPVLIIGSSLTGIDKHLTAVIEATKEVAASYRSRSEKLWSEAAVVPACTPAGGSQPA